MKTKGNPMINIKQNHSLLNYNTFKVKAQAKYFIKITKTSQINEVLKHPQLAQEKIMVLGGGANVLFIQNFTGIILHMNIKGRQIIEETADHVTLQLGAGEDWHQTVMYSVKQNWGGIENMALIPSSMGAAPIQNIAAFGQNFSDVFVSLQAVERSTNKEITLNKEQCGMRYRGSSLKDELAGQYIITKVTIKLSKKLQLETSYYEMGKSYTQNVSINAELADIAKKPYKIKDIAKAVINIRTRKLPDIKKIGSAGSFFENPVISKVKLAKLQKLMKNLQYYPLQDLKYDSLSDIDQNPDNYVKVPAGKLLDELGWKGKIVGKVGVHPYQALCVINLGGGSGQEILQLTNQMKADCLQAYGIKLRSEVVVV